MNTDQLIAALAADVKGRGVAATRGLWLAFGCGLSVAAIAFAATIGVRGDLVAALSTWRFDVKLLIVCAALIAALIDCLRLLRPEVRPSWHWSTATMLLLLLAAVGAELTTTPLHAWGTRMIGTNGLLCIVAIPLLAVAPFAALIWAMRRGAPASATWTGAAAGRFSAAMGAALYALHCFDDSPLFVAVWYSAATLIVSVVGAVLGARFLKW